MINSDMSHCAAWHSGMECFFRILNYSDSTHSLDCLHPRGPIVEIAGKDYGNCATTVRLCGASKQGIERRSMAVLPRAADRSHAPREKQQMPIRWRHVNLAGRDWHFISRVNGRQATCPTENPG